MDLKNHKLSGLMGGICLISALIGIVGNLSAGNLTQEQRISHQLDTPALKGEAVWLKAGNSRFLTILNKASAAERIGGVILLHDAGAHADWHEVIGPLRTFLSRRGWGVLSLQMPVSNNPADSSAPESFWQETRSRIQAAVDHFSSQENNNLILLGHGQGAAAALYYLEAKPSPKVRAYVAISLPLHEDSRDRVISAMEKLTGPMLDIYGSQDQPSVTDSAEMRQAAGKRSLLKLYRQDQIMGADHYFRGVEASLLRRIDAWLKRVAQGQEETR